jgi:RNA polymerase sigma-70 factor (ECF subfamily)
MRRDEPEGIDELQLVKRARSGDQDAFHRLFASYEPRLLWYLTNMLGDSENARDVLQETFIAAFRALPRWEPPNSDGGNKGKAGAAEQPGYVEAHPLAPWLYRIATNRALNFIRGQAPANAITVHHLDEQFSRRPENAPLEAADRGMTFEDRYALRELLHQALHSLSEEDASCLVLRFVAGERYSEIADQLGMTREAVRKRISRGIIALRAAYQALDTEVHS